MKHLQTYNESLKDKMTAKTLSDNQQKIYDAVMDLDSIDIPVNNINSNKNPYGFSFYHYDKKIDIYYTDQEEDEKTHDWHMYIINNNAATPTEISNKLIVPEENTWNSMLLEIINIYYKNPGQKREDAIKSIIKLEDKIELKKELIEVLDKVIKIKTRR